MRQEGDDDLSSSFPPSFSLLRRRRRRKEKEKEKRKYPRIIPRGKENIPYHIIRYIDDHNVRKLDIIRYHN